MTAEKVRETLAYACGRAGSAINWAGDHKISAAYVSDVINGRKEPGKKILDALGLIRVIDYRKVSA